MADQSDIRKWREQNRTRSVAMSGCDGANNILQIRLDGPHVTSTFLVGIDIDDDYVDSSEQ